ncbi:hypothetical protein Mp_4g22060 [Marchantia polymorpha subsp. ruderalis]|uniref:Uncharacterized protein n=2 Tax=Marchantia polymorpha TaxID=3197 RepID=A0AAF6BCH6_MARPO|nr:hypothetical protein MARPO_1721s0002 [Marchantia polymorpha]BBN09710.1 hypothetical protein Mp_4g22060 [Marchantia polymorpha subsp. ruderalis]|eukprot:PTQ26431.1 hypothetical protein MARPO_1721s0002 [Marchantia polymorpha]
MNEVFAFSKFPKCCVFLAPNCWINELICLWFVRKRFLSLAFVYNAFQKFDVKQFVKSLQCHHTKPDASFCGIAPNYGCLLIMLQYFIPGTRQTDNSISLHYRLPVLLDGAN